MTEAKRKADELVGKYYEFTHKHPSREENAVECALICVENEYKASRELLFNLRATSVIESEKVYLLRLEELIDNERDVKEELNKMIK